jgi:heptaprenylglyceryl phosphate synthase
MPQAVPNIEKLDEHLQEVVHALHGAVKLGGSHSNDSKVVDNAIEDCKEILDVIMAGKVSEWLN